MKRRTFIKNTAVLGIASLLPLWSQAAFGAALSPAPLFIPPLLSPDAKGQIKLNIQEGFTSWIATKQTPTWGINGSLLAPTLRLKKGEHVDIIVNNSLSETTTLHWHGLEVPGSSDGGPQALIAPKQQWTAQFKVAQAAATCWFHPHTHQQTGRQVAMGLGGMLIIDDENSAKLPLPSTWGVDDIPVILQDKRLTPEAKIDYKLDLMSAAVGWFGDMMLTNGGLCPEHSSPKGWLRLRFLNASNARTLRLATSDKRPMYVIASDGGFLAEPVKLDELTIFTGERFEVLIENTNGKEFDILTLPVRQMGMTVAPFDVALPVLRIKSTGTLNNKKLPDQLVKLAALPALDKLPTRFLKLSMNPKLDMQGMQELVNRYGEKALAGISMDHSTMSTSSAPAEMDHSKMDMGSKPAAMDHSKMDMGSKPAEMDHSKMDMGSGAESELDLYHSNFINNQAFEMNKHMFDVKQGQYEKWTISGEGDMMSHPFHIHGTQFRILSENGQPPAAHRSGFKDIVHVENKRSEVLVKFDHLAPAERAYMAHCHLLEHEDTGMMLSFTVSK